MDAEVYFAEMMMRARIAEVRASAEVARLLRESTECSHSYGVGFRHLPCSGPRNAPREAPLGTRHRRLDMVLKLLFHFGP